MRLTEHRWPGEAGRQHWVVRAEFDQDDVDRAKGIARLKIEHIDVHTPGGVVRDRNVIYSRITAGKLADAAVREYLVENIGKQDRPVKVIEYDQVRTDSFERPDPYDLLLRAGERTCDVEVRSSFSYQLFSDKKMIQSLSVYGWYTSTHKRHEPKHALYWQFLYRLRPADKQPPEKPKYRWPELPVFEERARAGAVTGYIVGGATREMLQDRHLSTERRDQDRASYRAIHPVIKAADCRDMLALSLRCVE